MVLRIKYFPYYFLVVEVVLNALNLLIVLVTLTSNKNDVALLGQHACCADSFATVYDAYYLLHLLLVETCQHIVDDILRLFESWVVGCDNHLIALFNGLLSHEWALTFITITTSATNGDDLALAVKYLVDGIEHVLKSIWCVGIVYNCSIAFRWI